MGTANTFSFAGMRGETLYTANKTSQHVLYEHQF